MLKCLTSSRKACKSFSSICHIVDQERMVFIHAQADFKTTLNNRNSQRLAWKGSRSSMIDKVNALMYALDREAVGRRKPFLHFRTSIQTV